MNSSVEKVMHNSRALHLRLFFNHQPVPKNPVASTTPIVPIRAFRPSIPFTLTTFESFKARLNY